MKTNMIENPISLGQKLADQSDRVLFFIVLVLFMGVLWKIITYLEASRTKHLEALEKVVDKSFTQAEVVTSVVARNTVALDNTSHVITEANKVLSDTNYELRVCRDAAKSEAKIQINKI